MTLPNKYCYIGPVGYVYYDASTWSVCAVVLADSWWSDGGEPSSCLCMFQPRIGLFCGYRKVVFV